MTSVFCCYQKKIRNIIRNSSTNINALTRHDSVHALYRVKLLRCAYYLIFSTPLGSGADTGFGRGGGGGAASDAESCGCRGAGPSELSAAGVGPGSFWVSNAQICILTLSENYEKIR